MVLRLPEPSSRPAMLEAVIAEVAPGTSIRDIDATDPATAARVRFPGSPTIRVNGRDVDPVYVDPGDYTPRCRLYRTNDGLRRLPERSWIEDALRGRQPATPAMEAPQRNPIAISMGSDAMGDDDASSIVGVLVIVGAACCVAPLAAAAGIGILPLAGAVAGVVAITGAIGRRTRPEGYRQRS